MEHKEPTLLATGSVFTCPKDNTVKEYTNNRSISNDAFPPEVFSCENNCDLPDCPVKR